MEPTCLKERGQRENGETRRRGDNKSNQKPKAQFFFIKDHRSNVVKVGPEYEPDWSSNSERQRLMVRPTTKLITDDPKYEAIDRWIGPTIRSSQILTTLVSTFNRR